jgi:hypothetical protein
MSIFCSKSSFDFRSILKPYKSPQYGRRKIRIPDYIEAYYIHVSILKITQEYLRAHGRKGEEGYLFWSGSIVNENKAYITTCVYPRIKTRYGGVKVPLWKMSKINEELMKMDQIILAQVHTHPGKFGHSDIDEQKAVSFHKGFISIVVPSFEAVEIYDLRRCYIYEYVDKGKWKLLRKDEITNKFVIEDLVKEI